MNPILAEVLHLLIDRAAGLLQHERDQLHARVDEAHQASQHESNQLQQPAQQSDGSQP